MTSIRAAMVASLTTPVARDLASSVSDVKTTFSSWDNCMAKTYCKYPVIAAIVVGGLIAFSVVWCIVRCACCGLSCCCGCFRCLSCFGTSCCETRGRRHKHLDESAYRPATAAHAGYVAPGPMMATAYTGPVIDTTPRYAQFEVGPNGHAVARKAIVAVNEDALPPMPGWDTAVSKKVADPDAEVGAVGGRGDIGEKDYEMGDLNATGQHVPLMSGARPGALSPIDTRAGIRRPYANGGSPAPSPYSAQEAVGYDYLSAGGNRAAAGMHAGMAPATRAGIVQQQFDAYGRPVPARPAQTQNSYNGRPGELGSAASRGGGGYASPMVHSPVNARSPMNPQSASGNQNPYASSRQGLSPYARNDTSSPAATFSRPGAGRQSSGSDATANGSGRGRTNEAAEFAQPQPRRAYAGPLTSGHSNGSMSTNGTSTPANGPRNLVAPASAIGGTSRTFSPVPYPVGRNEVPAYGGVAGFSSSGAYRDGGDNNMSFASPAPTYRTVAEVPAMGGMQNGRQGPLQDGQYRQAQQPYYQGQQNHIRPLQQDQQGW